MHKLIILKKASIYIKICTYEFLAPIEMDRHYTSDKLSRGKVWVWKVVLYELTLECKEVPENEIIYSPFHSNMAFDNTVAKTVNLQLSTIIVLEKSYMYILI